MSSSEDVRPADSSPNPASTPETSSERLPESESPDTSAVRGTPDVLSDLERLDQVLCRETDRPVLHELTREREALPGTSEDRRRQDRHPLVMPIAILQVADDERDDRLPCQLLHGQTLNLSPSGIAFVTPQPLTGDSVIAVFRHPDHGNVPAWFALTVFRSRQVDAVQWEHGAVLRSLVPGPVVSGP